MPTTIATNVKKNKTPNYRRRKGYSQAIVTLTDSKSGKRKDYWLGKYGTPASHEMYHRVLAQWVSLNYRFPPTPEDPKAALAGISLNEMVLAYWQQHASSYYSPAAAGHIKTLIRLTRALFGSTAAATFGPNDLRLVRESMIKGDAKAEPPRKPWSRCYVNSQVHQLIDRRSALQP